MYSCTAPRRSQVIRCLAVTALGASPGPMWAQTSAVTAFTHVAVIPMDSERVLPNQTLLVRGDRIVALGPVAQVQVPVGAIQIDGTGKFLIPGLADMHAHICGVPCTPSRTAPDKIAPDLLPYLANGVTTVREMHGGGPDSPMLAVRQAVAHGQVLGPRIYTAGDPTAYLTGDTSAADASVSTVALKAAGHDFVKLNGWTGAVYDSVVAAAHRVHLPIVGHFPPYGKFADVLNDRWASFEHLMGYLDYAMGLEGRWYQGGLYGMDLQRFIDTAAWMRPTYPFPDSAVRTLATATRRAGAWNCPTLITQFASTIAYLHGAIASDPDDDEAKAGLAVLSRLQVFNNSITKALQDAGAGLLLGTDAIIKGPLVQNAIPGFSVHGELQLLVQAGLTPYQALATGTRNVADFLGTADSTGTVTVGKRADLVLLRGNPLQDIRATMHPVGVMVGGRWLPPTLFDDAKAQVLQQLPDYPEAVLQVYYPELLQTSSP